MNIDVLVPVYGNWPAVRSCLMHLLEQSAAAHVVVVDDCSPDDTADRIEAEFPGIDLLRLPKNVGFAKACNRGFDATVGDVVVLLNSDVDLAPESLSHLANAFDDPSVASASPVITRPDGQIDAVGLCADVTLAGFVRFHGAPPQAAASNTPIVLGPYGAVAAYRRSSIDTASLFDPNIFMYGEELDLALRLRRSGWTSVVVQESRAQHEGGATTGRGSAKQRRLAGFGRGYLLRKYGVLHSRFGPRALFVELFVCAYRLFASRDLAAIRGRIDGWHAARGVERLSAPTLGVDRTISTLDSLRMRSGQFWLKAANAGSVR